MLHGKLSFVLLIGRLSVFAVGILLFLPTLTVEAQCGTQASSCKNCHEVQGELPVNFDGTGWHESHAFGDFCYICHAGNQQATDIDAAHVGLVSPLSDVNASCQMCHAADLDERAQVYAVALNINLNGASGDSGSAAPTSEPSADDFWGSEPVVTTAPVEAAAPAPASDDEALACLPLNNGLVIDDASFVDYVRRYDEIVLGNRPVNWGNVALIGIIGLLVVGGGGFVIWNEVRLNASRAETKKAEGEYPADVVDMLPALSDLKPQPRNALKKILANPQKTDKVLGLIDSVMSDDKPEEHG